MPRYVCELPEEVLDEIREDIIDIMSGEDIYAIKEATENVMDSKLIDVIGSEPGLLSYKKYSRWL